MAEPGWIAHAHWWPADSEISAATLQGSDLHLALSATQLSEVSDEGLATSGHVSGHASGLLLVCQGLSAASLAALPPLGELLGRVAEGRLKVGDTWHRSWPVAQPVCGPDGARVQLQWHLANRTDLTLACTAVHMTGLDGAAFFPSMAC